MSDKRVNVWVQQFKDRDNLMLQWLDPETGKRKTKSAETADPAKAEKARADLEYELNHGRYQEASKMTWERFRELFEEEYVAGLRPNTRENYADMLNSFEKLCSPSRLRAIDARTVSRFTAQMRRQTVRGKEGLMPSTIKMRLQFFHSALSWAVEKGLLPKVPAFPAVKVPKKKPQEVPLESFERLLAKATDSQMKTYLLCGWLAGLRLAEAMHLEWAPAPTVPYVDTGRNRIILPAEFVKGVEDQWLPLDPELRRALEALPRHGKKVFRFVDSQGQLLTESGLCQRVGRLAKKAGVRLTMKTLRAGFGCRYAKKVSAHVLQRLMRHADIKTTMTYYVNIDQAVEEAVLGRDCNSSRNREGQPAANHAPGHDTSPSANSTNRP